MEESAINSDGWIESSNRILGVAGDIVAVRWFDETLPFDLLFRTR